MDRLEDAIRIFYRPVLEKADAHGDYGEARIIAFGVVDDRELAVFNPSASTAYLSAFRIKRNCPAR
jgi:hypothetical protein